MTPELYRNLMRHQAGAVALIATGRPGARTGMAVLVLTATCTWSCIQCFSSNVP